MCSYVDDAISIAAAFQSLIAFLFRLRSLNQSWRKYPSTLINENRWRAQRYGTNERLIDHGKAKLVQFPELVEELIGLLSEDAEDLGCLDELRQLRRIIKVGNSTDRQRKTLRDNLSRGKSKDDALRAVVKQLMEDYLHRFPREASSSSTSAREPDA